MDATISGPAGVGSGVRADIEAVLRRLPFKAGTEERLPHVVRLLSQIATAKPPPDTAFRRAGRARCEAELKALRRAAEALVKAIGDLHKPTILALAASPASWLARAELRQLAQQAAEAARRADVSGVDAACKVQPRNRRSVLVANLLADEYERMTGVRPTVRTCDGIAYGPFFDLVREMFIAMGLRESPEVASRNSVRRRLPKP